MPIPFSSMLIFFRDRAWGYGLPAGDVLGEGLLGTDRKHLNVDRMIHREAGVLPVDELILQEKFENHSTEVLRHSLDIPVGWYTAFVTGAS